MAPHARAFVFLGGFLMITAPTPAVSQIDGLGSSGQKSVSVAVALSLLGTTLPILSEDPWLVGAGIAIGPNLGDVYLGDAKRVFHQSLLRAGVMVGTVGLMAGLCSSGCDFVFGDDDSGVGPALVVGIIGGVITAGLVGREVRGLPDRVRAWNARHASGVTIHPAVDPSTRRLGLRLTIRH